MLGRRPFIAAPPGHSEDCAENVRLRQGAHPRERKSQFPAGAGTGAPGAGASAGAASSVSTTTSSTATGSVVTTTGVEAGSGEVMILLKDQNQVVKGQKRVLIQFES